MVHEEVTTLRHTKRSEQDLNLEVKHELKETTATYENVQNKKKLQPKVGRIEPTFGQIGLEHV